MVDWMGAPNFLVFTSKTFWPVAASVMPMMSAVDNRLFFIKCDI